MNNKKTIIALSVSAILLSACGGGGGGGNVPNIQNHNTTNNQSNLNQNNTSVSEILNASRRDKEEARTGKGATVLLADTGIDLNRKQLKDKNINPQMVINQNGNLEHVASKETNSNHGSNMSQIITNNAKDVQIEQYAYEVGKEGINTITKNTNRLNKTLGGNTIINNSYTDGRQDSPEKYKSLIQFLKDNIDNNNSLMIYANGNETHANPDSTSRIPLLDKNLEKGFIAVSGTHNGEMLYNKCGVSKNFCLSAEAYHQIHNKDNKPFVNGGTSSATAYVSATAAQIKSRYDWMSNEQIKDTLFTTATDAGEKGIDDVFGVGIMNADKALNGIARLDKAYVMNVAGRKNTYYFDNDIAGEGSIIKNGNDTLVLNGNNSYTGKNQINDGKLILNGRNVAGNNINKNGVLAVGDKTNTSSISSGEITNNGKLESITTADLIVNGNLNNNGVIDKAIGSKIQVNGQLNINGGDLNVVGVAKGYVTKSGKTENLILSHKINGRFDNVNAHKVSDLIKNKVEINDQNIYVVISRGEVGDVVAMQSSYEGKDVAIKNISSLLTKFDNDVDSGKELNDEQAKVASTIINSNNLTKTMFEMGTETQKHAVENINQNELKQNITFINKTQNEVDSVWVDYGYNEARLKMDGISGKSSDNSFTVGGSYKYGEHIFGAAASYKNLNWSENFENANKSVDAKGYGFDLGYVYNINKFDSQVYAMTGYNKFKLTNYSSSNLNQYHFGVGLSKWFQFNKLFLQPNVALSYVYSKANNAQVFDGVGVENLSSKQLTLNVGANANYKVSDTFSILGSLNIENDIVNKVKYNANYAGEKFENTSNDIGKTRINAGVGVQYQATNNLSLSAMLKHEQGKNWKNNSANATLVYKF